MQIESRIDLSLNVFCVMIATGDKKRPYFFNIPTDVNQRGAQVFECCVGEAISRHEAWVSGNATSFGAVSSPTSVEEDSKPAASQVANKKKPSAPVQEKVEEPVEDKPAVSRKKKVEPVKQVLVTFEKNDFCKKAFSDILTAKFGQGWTKDKEIAADAKEIAGILEAKRVTVAIDGEIQQEFIDRVNEELDARYE